MVAQAQPDKPPSSATSFVPHREDAWWWLSGQVNLISQAHGRFTSPYEGDNSLRPAKEQALSRIWTVYTGVKLPLRHRAPLRHRERGRRRTERRTRPCRLHEPRRRPQPHARLGSVRRARDAPRHHCAQSRRGGRVGPTPSRWRRMSPRVASISAPASWAWRTSSTSTRSGSDSHLQFTNWTVDNNGAYDYAADTRGYTYAAIVEYDAPPGRFGSARC